MRIIQFFSHIFCHTLIPMSRDRGNCRRLASVMVFAVSSLLVCTTYAAGLGNDRAWPNSTPESRVHDLDDGILDEIAQAADVDEAVTVVSDFLVRHRFRIVAVINHTSAARRTDQELGPTRVIYAYPNAQTLRALQWFSDTLALDLPLKYLVYEDDDNDIHVETNRVGYLIDRHSEVKGLGFWSSIGHVAEKLVEPDTGIVTIKSELDIDDANAAIKSAIQAIPAFGIPLELEMPHRHRDRRQRLIVFGNPLAGTPMMQAVRSIALDLPQEILVTAMPNGGSLISYNDPFFIAKRYNLMGQDARLTAIAAALANFAEAGR